MLSSTERVPVTTLPESYFVAILGEDENRYEVSYLDVTGYVEKDKVTLVDYEPLYKYHERGFITLSNDGHDVNVRSAPSAERGEVDAVLKSGDKLFYYGTVEGDAQVEAVGNAWYFVRYYDLSGEARRGYVYSLYASAEAIPKNTIEVVRPPDESEDVVLTQPESFILPVDKEAMIVVALCLPVVIVTFLLFHERKS